MAVAAPAAAATWYNVVGGADSYWRMYMPAKHLAARVEAISEEDAYDLVLHPHTEQQFPWLVDDDGGFRYPAHEGTAVWTRPDPIRAKHMLAMQDQGILTVAETDDNYLADPHLNIFMRINRFDADRRSKHLMSMATADRVIFSTGWLRDEYHKAFKQELPRKWPRPELFVARNHVDLDDWPVRDEGTGRLRIGWMGSDQHYRDLKLVFGALEWAAQQGHEVVIVGLDPGNETGVTNPKALEACRRWQTLGYRSIPWVSPEEYHRTALPLDIGLIPLELNKATLGKSDVKALEYTLSGAAVIAQNMSVYRDWTHGETCLKANSPGEFWWQLQQLVQDENLRERLVVNAQEYVREHRTIQRNIHEWRDAIVV